MKIGDYVMTPWGPGVLVAIDLPADSNRHWGVCFTGLRCTRADIWGARHPPSAYFWPHEITSISSAINWVTTTEDDYWEMLCVLPPERQRNGWFLVGEPVDSDPVTGNERFQAYRQTGVTFERSERAMTIDEFTAAIEQAAKGEGK